MKKTKIIFAMLLIIVLILTGCSNVQSNGTTSSESNESSNNEDETESNGTTSSESDESSNNEDETESNGTVDTNGLYQALIYDYSDSVPSAKHEVEYVFADYERFSDIVVDDNIEILINNISYSGKFQSSQYREFNYFPVHCYVDENGLMFEVDESGMLISCFWGNASSSGVEITEEKCLTIARNFLASIVDVDDYEVSVVEDSERGMYTVNFTKTIRGLKTKDSATIVVNNDGSLYSYSSFMLGRVTDELTSTDVIDIDKVKKSVNNKLNLIYEDACNIYSRIKYSEPIVELTVLKNGEVGVVCTVNVECVEIAGEFETSVSERINFIVIID